VNEDFEILQKKTGFLEQKPVMRKAQTRILKE